MMIIMVIEDMMIVMIEDMNIIILIEDMMIMKIYIWWKSADDEVYDDDDLQSKGRIGFISGGN